MGRAARLKMALAKRRSVTSHEGVAPLLRKTGAAEKQPNETQGEFGYRKAALARLREKLA